MLPIDKSAMAKNTLVNDNYLDQNSLNVVKAMGRKNDPQALKEIAKKFEAMFVQQMLKSMREANEVFSEGDMFSSSEVKFHQEMLDQQMVLNLTSGKGIGLATSMYQQMQTQYGKKNAAESIDDFQPLLELNSLPELKSISEPSLKPLSFNSKAGQPPHLISRATITASPSKVAMAQTPEEFVAALMPYANKASAELHINTDVLLAQAALETGWGKHVIHDAQGNSSFNMFNIKKNNAWNGKSVGVQTLEFKNGIAQQERAEFRQYDNYLHSFADYVNMIKNNPRYQQALNVSENSARYADALQAAGYATDPHYAEKIKQLLTHSAISSATNSAISSATNSAISSATNSAISSAANSKSLAEPNSEILTIVSNIHRS